MNESCKQKHGLPANHLQQFQNHTQTMKYDTAHLILHQQYNQM